MKIAVLFTGGTIGSRSASSVLDVSESTMSQLFVQFNKLCPNSDVEFVPEMLFSVLSENMTASNWKEMYNWIVKISKTNCDGIIITHGTDTLAYTANFFSFMLKEIGMPVLLVSSDYPINDQKSNGLQNFIAAVDFIKNVGTKGVFVPFHKDGKTNIHLGSRLLQAHSFLHCFGSLGNVVYGKMINGEFERNSSTNNPTPEAIEKRCLVSIPCFPEERSILYLKPYLGFDYSVLEFKIKPDAVIHGLYHSGTACAEPAFEKNSIIVFAKRCIAQGIDFYAAPYDSRYSMYRTAKDMLDIGIKFIENISCAAAYTKLLIAYGSFSDVTLRQKFIGSNIACEQLYTISRGCDSNEHLQFKSPPANGCESF